MFKYTEKKLAKDIGKVAKLIDPSLQSAYFPDTREVKLTTGNDDDSGTHTIFLGNLFVKISSMPRKERLPTIETFLREALAPKDRSPDEIMASLALRIRTDFEVDFRNRHLELQGHGVLSSVSFRRGQLLVEVVSDNDESVSILQHEDLEEIDVTEEQAIAMAAARIRRATNNEQWKQVDESIWKSTYEDDYDFARIVAAEDHGSFPFDGTPVVFAPSHSVCLVTDSTNPQVLSKMIDMGYEDSANHRMFCQLLWTLEDGGVWKEWQPDQASDARSISQLQVVRETVNKYEESKTYFNHLLGEDVFVATYQAIQNDDGLTCYCAYTLDLPSYLPVTDFVALVDSGLPENETVIGRVEWHEFEECLGSETLESVDKLMDPPWCRVMQPLNASQRDRLRQLARPLN